jgi:hypothetical protein
MLDIAIHLKRLLLVNDCVIIPDFGGFVLQNHPAVYERDAHRFCPAHKEMVFNPTLKHDDGLLTESYMQTYGMTFNQARSALKKDVVELKAALDKQGAVDLEAIGVFRKEAETAMVFQPSTDRVQFGLLSYGLATFYFPPARAAVENTPAASATSSEGVGRKSGRVIYAPFSRTLLYAAGVLIAAVVLSLAITTPIKEVNPVAYTASFAPSEMVRRMAPPDTAPAVDAPPPAGYEKAETPAAETVSALPDKPLPTKTYYVIIGSFRTENQAQTFMQQTAVASLQRVGIVRRGEHIRVFAAKYDNRKEAENCLLAMRKDVRYKDVWLFIDKG